MTRSLRTLAATALAMTALACAEPAPADPADASSPDAAPSARCAATPLVRVTGRILDEHGAPIPGARAQLCLRTAPTPPDVEPTLLCVPPPSTAADGTYTIDVPLEGRCVERAVMRALAPPRALATTYCVLDLRAARDGALHVAPDVELRAVSREHIPERGDPSLPRSVTLAPGVMLELAPDALVDLDDYERLAAARVDPRSSCLRGELDGAIALYPEASLSRGARVRIANEGAYPPGAAIELSLLGGLGTVLADGRAVEEGELAVFGVAHVSADGAWIESDPGSELPYLSWLAWRALPLTE